MNLEGTETNGRKSRRSFWHGKHPLVTGKLSIPSMKQKVRPWRVRAKYGPVKQLVGHLQITSCALMAGSSAARLARKGGSSAGKGQFALLCQCRGIPDISKEKKYEETFDKERESGGQRDHCLRSDHRDYCVCCGASCRAANGVNRGDQSGPAAICGSERGNSHLFDNGND
jgi:hypothetical protein